MNITGTTKGNDQKPESGAKPVNTVKDDIENGKMKPEKSKNPAKQREQSEQPVHPIKKAPKDQQ